NKAKASVAAKTDGVLGSIDAMDSGTRNDQIADARRYAARRKAETVAGIEEPPPDARPRAERQDRFPNSMKWTDDEVYKQVSETMYPDFRTLPAGDKKWGLCEIARYDRKIVDTMRAIGSAYIDTVRNLVEGNDGLEEGYRAVLLAAGIAEDREIETAFKAWHDDSYSDDFYADDDGGHKKAVRMLGWLVFSRVGGARGGDGAEILTRSFADAGVRDVYSLAKKVGKARTLIDAREAVVEQHFRPRRASFASQFLVQRGLNADVTFVWLDDETAAAPEDDALEVPLGATDDDDDGGESPFEI
ncbi:MAG TPA: hypothetical protein VMV18_09580, partial [bacterium]|nr:hypothetical protein [bacterium]